MGSDRQITDSEQALEQRIQERMAGLSAVNAQLREKIRRYDRELRDHKQAEAELRQSGERLQLALEGSGDGLWDWDIRNGNVYLSPRWLAMLGYSVGELPGHVSAWERLIHPDDKPWVMQRLNDHLANSSVPFTFEYRILTQSGEWKWIANYGKVVASDQAGKPLRMAGTHKDISDRKQAEEALRVSEERWQLALRGTNDGIWDWNVQTGEIFFSKRWKEMLGFEDSEISHSLDEWGRRVHPDDFDQVMQAHDDHFARKTPFYAKEYRLQCKDGGYKWILDRGQALWDENGNVVRMLGSHTDITERKAAEDALKLQNQRIQLLADLSRKIHQSLQLDEILQTTVTEVQKLLQADRVLINQFQVDGAERVLAEAVKPEWPTVLGRLFPPDNFLRAYPQPDSQRTILADADLQTAAIDPGFREQLQQISVQARLAVCIFTNHCKWGLLVVHHCATTRQWQSCEIELLEQLADQMGIALSQAKLLNHLEEKVAERTAELTGANQQLQQEIHEREQVETALGQNERTFRAIFNNTFQFMGLLQPDGLLIEVNQTILDFAGVALSDVVGKPFWQAHWWTLSSLTQTRLRAAIAQAAQGQFVRYEVDVLGAHDRIATIDFSLKPVTDEAGQVVLLISEGRDISDRKVIDRMKDEFVSVVSHELRTPLTSIHGSLKLLATGRLGILSDEGRQMLEIADENTDRLVRLVSDVLDLQRIESGKVEMDKQPCDTAELMLRATEAMQGMAQQHGVTLSTPPTSILIEVDVDYIIQTLTNLLSNAIKFSPAGGTIWLTAELAPGDRELEGDGEIGEMIAPKAIKPKSKIQNPKSPNSTPYITFQIKDQGQGIPPNKLERVFERFQQVDASDSRSKGGAGLGLTICRRIVEQHGGKIWAESRLGKGSSFYVKLPIARE